MGLSLAFRFGASGIKGATGAAPTFTTRITVGGDGRVTVTGEDRIINE